MSEYFKNGGSHLEGIGAFEQHTAATGRVGYGSSDNDPNGSCYWADKDNMDPIWQYHDSRIAEHELGFNKGSMNGNDYVRVDCDDLSAHNQRVANGYEQGANEHFTGIVSIDKNGNKTIDPEVYNERTSGGQPECVTDQIDSDYCKFSEPQKFNDPTILAQDLCDGADALANAPEYDGKQADLAQWNADADALKDRMSGEQEYLRSRIADHEDRMSQFPEGSLEYTRASDNRTWCQDYLNELENSKSALQAKQNELNNSNNQIAGELPPQTPTNNSPENHVVAGELPPQTPKEPQTENAISGTTPDQAQGIDLSPKEPVGKSGKDIAEDTAKNAGSGFDPNNGIG